MSKIDKINKYTNWNTLKKVGLKGSLIFGGLEIGLASLGCSIGEARLDNLTPTPTLEQSVNTPTPTVTLEATHTPIPTPTPEPELSREEELALLGFKEGPELHYFLSLDVLRYKINDEIRILFVYFDIDRDTRELVFYDCFNDVELARMPHVSGEHYSPEDMFAAMELTNPLLEGAQLLNYQTLILIRDSEEEFPEIDLNNTEYKQALKYFMPGSKDDIPHPRRTIAEIYLDIVSKENRVTKEEITPNEKEDTIQSGNVQ